jgi:hypothetical protein
MERVNAVSTSMPRSRWQGSYPEPNRSQVFRFSAALSMPLEVQGSVRLSECGLAGGPRVELSGAAVLAGLGTTLRFAPRAGRGMPEGAAQSAMLIPPGEWFVVSAVSARAPISGGSPCRIQFQDGDGKRLSESYSLGPCGEEPRGFALSFQVPVAVTVEIVAEVPPSGPAPLPTIGGALVFLRGILARCVFLASGDAVGSLAAHADAVAIPIGQTIRFPEQLMPGTQPIKLLRALSFLDGHGHPLGRFVSGAWRRERETEKGGGVI